MVTVAGIAPLAAEAAARREVALAHLATLADLYDRGMREPLPLACLSSAAYAAAAAGGEDAATAAHGAWEADRFRAEAREPEHELVLGGVRPLAAVLAEPARADEAGAGWEAAESTRFGRYACRMWAGLLAAEQVTER